MVFVKHNSLKSGIFFNPIFIPGFSGSRLFSVPGPGPGSRVLVRVGIQGPGPGSRVQVQVPEVAKVHIKTHSRMFL